MKGDVHILLVHPVARNKKLKLAIFVVSKLIVFPSSATASNLTYY